MRVEVKPDHVQFEEEEQGESYIKDRVKSLTLVRNLSFLAILLFIAQIVLDSIHLSLHKADLAVSLLTTAIVFLLGAGLIIYWTNQATKAYKANTELFQPRVNDRLTKTIYIAGLVFATTAIVLLVNTIVQREYSPDYVVAHSAVSATWDETYPGRTVEGLSKFFRVIAWIQVGFNAFYIIYFLVVARTAFKCLKFDNQAMSYLTFLGNALLLAFGLAIVFLADHALGYSDYPQIRAHFPFWNIKGLYFAGCCVAVISLVGFLVDHRSWRIGFLVLSFLLLVLIVLLGNFTGFAYRHVRETYNYYKGVPDVNTCLNRIPLINLRDLEDYGCPQKYLPHGTECDNPRVTPWEDLETTTEEPATSSASAQQAAAAPADSSSADQSSAAAADSTQAAADQSQTAADQQQAAADQSQAAANDQQDAADAAQTNADQQQAAADAAQTDADQQQAAADSAQGAADQQQASADQSQTAADQQQAAADQSADAAPADSTSTDDAAAADSTSTDAAPADSTSTDDAAAADSTSTDAAPADSTSTDTTTMFFDVDLSRGLQSSADDSDTYCYNLKCCGIMGQLYTEDFLILANFGLLAMLAAVLISIACYYFWFVKWVDAARDKRKDYIWLFVMVATLVGFIVAMVSWNLAYPNEQLDSNGNHTF